MLTLPPLTLYVHLPWCLRKCPYCDFNSYALTAAVAEDLYIEALLADYTQALPHLGERHFSSVFIGGGTPSLFSPKAIERLLTQLYPLRSPNSEITLEANPSSVEQQRFQGFQQAGITRISLGVQSFDNQALQQLGRVHNGQQAHDAIEALYRAGFDNFNLDLMFGLPGQTPETALNDLQQAVYYRPSHLSWYQLTLEPHTPFYAKPPAQLPNEDQLWDIQTAGQVCLADYSYEHYEISAYAQGQRYCQHNLNYWQFGDYLGIGAGAHSKLTNINMQHIMRFSKQAQPDVYLRTAHSSAVIATQEQLSPATICLEFMMNALRLTTGFTLEHFSRRTGLAPSYLAKPLQQAFEAGWLRQNQNGIQTTPLGQQFLDSVLALFVTG